MKGASQIAPFGLRMPEELKDAVAERAKKNGRSMNAEIVQILEDAISDIGGDIHANDLHELREVIKIQAELLTRYSDAISHGTDILKEANQRNKKS